MKVKPFQILFSTILAPSMFPSYVSDMLSLASKGEDGAARSPSPASPRTLSPRDKPSSPRGESSLKNSGKSNTQAEPSSPRKGFFKKPNFSKTSKTVNQKPTAPLPDPPPNTDSLMFPSYVTDLLNATPNYPAPSVKETPPPEEPLSECYVTLSPRDSVVTGTSPPRSPRRDLNKKNSRRAILATVLKDEDEAELNAMIEAEIAASSPPKKIEPLPPPNSRILSLDPSVLRNCKEGGYVSPSPSTLFCCCGRKVFQLSHARRLQLSSFFFCCSALLTMVLAILLLVQMVLHKKQTNQELSDVLNLEEINELVNQLTFQVNQ